MMIDSAVRGSWAWMLGTGTVEYVAPWKYCWMKHLQLNCYIKGVKGTDRVLKLGYGPCYKNKYGKPNGETH